MCIVIGTPVMTLGWEAAKRIGDTTLSDVSARVEAVGYDWLVLRDENGQCHALDFSSSVELECFWHNMTVVRYG